MAEVASGRLSCHNLIIEDAKPPQPGELDDELDEFWVDDPWAINKTHNLSSFERNLTFLNVEGKHFLDISYITGADGDGDGRCIIGADLRNNGQLDLIVRQVGGGALIIYENHLSQNNFLKVSLRGNDSNRLGIGARLIAQIGTRKIVRELYPQNTFRSQMPNITHLGLGNSETIDILTVVWPTGESQEWKNLSVNQHIILEEGNSTIETITPGQQFAP